MDIFRRRSSLQLCRLCGRCDRHKIDILNHDFPFHDGNVKKLCEIILDCVGIKVAGGDKLTTKLCENCLTKVNYIFRFRELCEATEMRMRILLSLPNGNAQAHSAIGLLDFTSAQAVADENTNEIRENTALNEEKSISRKRQRSNKDSCDSETNKRKSRRTAFSAETQALDIQPIPATLNHDAVECSDKTINDYSEVELSSTFCDDDVGPLSLADARDENGKNKNSFCVASNPGIYLACETNEPISTGTVSEEVVVGAENVKVVENCKTKTTENNEMKLRKREKRKLAENVEITHIKCKAPVRCEELFESTEEMMYHVTTYHAKGIRRKFSCHLCKKSYRWKLHLRQHIDAIHAGLRRFKCSFPDCSMAFVRNYDLQKHKNAIHTKEIDFKCTKCPSKFYQKRQLTRHMANKHGKGITYSCYLCKKSLSENRLLLHHMNVKHTGQSLFHCPSCLKGFANKTHLNRHLKSKFLNCGRQINKQS